MRRSGRRGFTLIELTITMGIIGVLATIAVPNYLGMIKKARKRILLEECRETQNEVHQWMTAVANFESGTVDFNCDGVLDETDDAMKPRRVRRIARDWDAIHGDGQPCAAYSPFDGSLPLFDRTARRGSGQIRITCNDYRCRVRGYTMEPGEPPAFDTMVALD